MDSIDIDVTDKCNLNCNYCYHKKQQKDISKTTIDKIKSYNPQKVSIMGGEPLLNFQGIMDTIGTLKPIDWSITSNLLELQPYMVSFIELNGGHITASLDGPFGERKQYERAIEIYKKYNRIMHTCRLTVTSSTVEYLYKNLSSLCSHGVKRVAIGFSEEVDWNEYRKQLKHITRLPMETNLYKHSKRCKAGDSLIAFSVDGKLYPCHRFIGNVKPFRNLSELQSFTCSIQNPICIGTRCSLYKICSKGCLYNLYKGNYFHCNFMRATHKGAM